MSRGRWAGANLNVTESLNLASRRRKRAGTVLRGYAQARVSDVDPSELSSTGRRRRMRKDGKRVESQGRKQPQCLDARMTSGQEQ